MSEPLLIEVLFAPGCESREETISLINRVVSQLSINPELREITVSSTEEAVHHHFLGSPSIHINGEDIDPDSINKNDYGFGWRVYIDEAGRFIKKIPEKMLVSAVIQKLKGQRGWRMGELICFCFKHSAEDIEQDVIKNGKSIIMEQIITDSKNGNCNCETNNPKGRWCLADVRQVVDKVMQKHGMKKPIDLQSL